MSEIDKPKDTYDGDEEMDNVERNKYGFVKFDSLSRPVQILMVGLLLGFGMFGGYLVIVGVNNMITPPVIITNGSIIETDIPIYYEVLYHKSDKHDELIITNINPIDAKTVWVGTPEEYEGFMNGKLMDGKQHVFTSKNNMFDREEISYSTDLIYTNQMTLSNIVSNSNKLIIVKDYNKNNIASFKYELKIDTNGEQIFRMW